jgi:hypothetical protein
MPVIDEREGRGCAFVSGEINQEPLAIGRHGVLLHVNARQGTAGNALLIFGMFWIGGVLAAYQSRGQFIRDV